MTKHLFLLATMHMDYLYIYLAAGFAVVFFFIGWYLRIKGRKELLEQRQYELQQAQDAAATSVAAPGQNFSSLRDPEIRRLQLQAYERLIILSERLALPALLGRISLAEHNVEQARNQLLQLMRTEYEYNISQQMYVSEAAWDGIKNLKEQHQFIVQQLAATLPPDAPAAELAQKIGELLTHEEHTGLQPIITRLLNQEARQLMLG